MRAIFTPRQARRKRKLEFWDSYAFNIVLSNKIPRSLDVNIVSGGVSENVFHFLSPVGANTGSIPFVHQSVDITNALLEHAGQTVQLSFVTTIPEYFSGPAGLGLDNVSLNVNTAPVVQVSEPGALGLLRRRKA